MLPPMGLQRNGYDLVTEQQKPASQNGHLGGSLGHHRLDSLYFIFLVTLCSMQDLSSLTRDRTRAPCIGAWSLSQWISIEVLELPSCPAEKWGYKVVYVSAL